MDLKKQNILFFCRATQHAGTENVVLQLCEILSPYVNKIIVCSSMGFKLELLQNIGIRHYAIPDIELKSPSIMLKIFFAVKSIIKKENITIVHTHHRMAAFYTSLLHRFYNFIYINTCHNTFTNKKRLTRTAYKSANLIACGEKVEKNLTTYFGLPNEQVQVIHNAVKPFKESLIQDSQLEELRMKNYFLVGNIGRLSEQKGMEYFIQSIPIVLKKHPKTKFLIIGSGENKEKLQKMVVNMNLKETVLFLGYRSDIQNVMSQLDLIVLSSLWEGLPLTPIEAFSVGKTVVATDVDGTSEIVTKENGILVESKNPIEIANAIILLATNNKKRKMLEENAYLTYLNKFSFDRFKKKYLDFYQSL